MKGDGRRSEMVGVKAGSVESGGVKGGSER
jgi:hypothetical protein